MLFSGKNFWENQGNAPAPPSPGIDPAAIVAAIRARGDKPSPEQIQAAIDYMDQKDPTGLAYKNSAGAFGDNTYEMQQAANNGIRQTQLQRTGDTAWTPTKSVGNDISKVVSGIDLGALLGVGKLGDMSGAGQGASDIAGGISGIGKLVADAANAAENRPPESIEELYARLQGQYGSPSYNGPSGDAMAKEEFDPQFAILKQIADQQKSRYDTGKSEIAGLYNSLVASAGQDRADNKKMYDAATGQINSNYKQASGNVSGNVQDSNAATAEMLHRLGQDQAVAKVSGDANAEAAKQLGYLASDQQRSANTNTQLGANQYSYDTGDIANTRQAGANSQQDLMQQYMDRQAQNDMQRLDLTGQQAKAGNAYDLQISQMLGDASQKQSSFVQNMVDQIMRDRQNQSDMQFKQAGMDLDLAKFGLDQDRFNASQSQYQNSQNDPYSALQQRAQGLYGDPGKASQASQQILNVYKANPNVKSLGDFLRSFVDEGNNLDPATQTLASYFISQILKNQPRQ